MCKTILDSFYEKVCEGPNNNALFVDGNYYSYIDLYSRACSLANDFIAVSKEPICCAIFSDRNIFAYQSILATLLSGNFYMSLRSQFPMQRNLRMINEAKPEIVCIATKEYGKAKLLLESISANNVFVFNADLYDSLVNAVSKHRYFLWQNSSNYSVDEGLPCNVPVDNYAYLLFTSGSTGSPKGIGVKHSNLSSYVNFICSMYKPCEDDRFLHLNELTFDLSVHDLFVCWCSGATLYVVPDNYMLGVQGFIQKHHITYLLLVPSVINLLNQISYLQSESFPSVKQSFFCGEPFRQTQAKMWQTAAPNSAITNLYGPTEATIAFTYFEWKLSDSDKQPDIIPIGKPLPMQKCRLVNEEEEVINDGHVSELCLSGSQVVDSYWNDKEQSIAKFKNYLWDCGQSIWYRSGDLARWDNRWGYVYMGRIDDQLQIRGYRVEKLEIENELRLISGCDELAVVATENPEGFVDGTIAFICADVNFKDLLKKMHRTLPDIMIPKKIIKLTSLPQSVHGKIDYQKLKEMVKEGAHD